MVIPAHLGEVDVSRRKCRWTSYRRPYIVRFTIYLKVPEITLFIGVLRVTWTLPFSNFFFSWITEIPIFGILGSELPIYPTSVRVPLTSYSFRYSTMCTTRDSRRSIFYVTSDTILYSKSTFVTVLVLHGYPEHGHPIY